MLGSVTEMTNYMPLPYSYNNNDSSHTLNQSLTSISQPETPQPGSPLKDESPKTIIRKHSSSIPSRSTNFTTTTFHSNPYPSAGPIRRRRTESIFSFEMGPTFSTTKQLYDILNMDQTNSYQVQLHAKMDRGFFRADQDWTCYRRNYFQVSATFDIHDMNYLIQGPEVPCLLRKPETRELLQVDYFSIGIGARVTSNDKKIELVQHTPKRDKGPQITPGPRPVRAGGNLHLASVGSNNSIVTFERLQFKTATANNGKRRAAQQYYEIVVNLYANFSRHQPLRVATCVSAPLVVRGRSPGHYADSHTRFKHINADSSISNNEPNTIPPVTMGNILHEKRFSSSSTTTGNNTNHHVRPTILDPPSSATSHRYPSLPNSPISEFGQYSPYTNGYPSLSGYPSIIPPPSSNSNMNHTTTSSSLSNPYFQNAPSSIYDNGYAPSDKNLKNWSSNNESFGPYMAQADAYGRSHHEEDSSYSSRLDAGRL